MGTEGTFLSTVKGIYGKSTANILLNGEKLKAFLSGAALGITDKMEARPPAPSPHSAGTDPGMKELGLVILTCLFLSSAELTEKEY